MRVVNMRVVNFLKLYAFFCHFSKNLTNYRRYGMRVFQTPECGRKSQPQPQPQPQPTATATNRNRNRNSEPQRCKNIPDYLTATPTAMLTATATATTTATLNRNASDYARDRKPSQIEGKIKSPITFGKNNF